MFQQSDAQLLPTVVALETLPRPALVLMQVLSLLDHYRIQEHLLKHNEGHALIDEYPTADRFDDEVIPKLLEQTLLSRDKKTKRVSVHQAIQDVVRQRMDEDEFKISFQIAVVLLNADWEYDRDWAFGHRLVDWKVADIVVPHVTRIATHFQVHKPVLPPASLDLFMSLVTRSSTHLSERGNWDDCLSLGKMALPVLEYHEDTMEEHYADILMTLSSSYNCLGEWRKGVDYAQAHFKQRLLVENKKPAAERDDSLRAMAYTELALAWLLNDDYSEAIILAVEGRKILEKTQEFLEGRCWPHWADYHHAWALIGKGRAEEARPILTKMLEWRRSQYGHGDTESMKTAYALQILGVVNEKAGHIKEAISTWERALLLYRKTEGDSSVRTNQVRVKLGEYYGKQGKAESAAKMFDTALQYLTGEKYYKAERARTFFKQCEFFESIGKVDEAVEARRQAERLGYEACGERARVQSQPLTLADFDGIVTIMSR